MAYVVESIAKSTVNGSSAGSLVANIGSKVQLNDLILLIVGNDTGNTTIAAAGYSDVPNTTQTTTRGNRGAALYKFAGASESNPTITGATDGIGVIAIIIREADTTTPFNVVGQTAQTASSSTIDSPSVTTTTNDLLVIRAMAGWDTFAYVMNPAPYRNLGRIDVFDDVIAVSAVEDCAVSSGATGALTWEFDGNDGGSAYTIAINNAAGAAQPIKYEPNLEIIRRYGSYGPVYESTTFAILGASITTLGGISVNNTDAGTVDDEDLMINIPDYLNGSSATSVRWSTAGEAWFGISHTITSTDFTGVMASIVLGYSNALVSDHSGDEGLAVVIFDSSNNWVAFRNPTSLYALDDEGITIMFNESTTPYDSGGTLDWTDIVKVGYAWHRAGNGNTTGRGICFRDLMLWGDSVFTGGGESWPITPTLMTKYMTPDATVTNAFSNVQATTQALVYRSIQVGDGTRDTYYSSSAQSLELPASGAGWKLPDNTAAFKINASAGSTIDLSASVLASDTLQDFTYNPASSASATYQASGFNLVHFTPSITVPTSGTNFIRCDEIDLVGAIALTRASITRSVSTGNALTMDAGGSLIDCEFVKADETYAVEMPTAGAYDLSGTTFSGYTNDLNVTAATGTVTITLEAGQAEPTYTSAGATVAFVQPTVDVTVTVRDIDTSALIENAVVFIEAAAGGALAAGTVILSGTTTATGIVTDSLIVSGNQPIIGRVRKSSATPFYTNYRISGTITTAGFSTTALMQRED